jgi:hypothetical protein
VLIVLEEKTGQGETENFQLPLSLKRIMPRQRRGGQRLSNLFNKLSVCLPVFLELADAESKKEKA